MIPICLDLTRLVSRIGKGPWTGIDRVEAAWMDRLCRGDIPAWALVRRRLGYTLYGAPGLAALASHLHSAEPAAAHAPQGRTLPRPALGLLLKDLPRSTVYLNTGHSNLTARVLATVARRHPVAVLIHDMIPLTHPQFQRPGMPETFQARMHRVAQHASLVIYNSAHTRAEAEHRFTAWGRVPPGLVAHLGLPPTAAPHALDTDAPDTGAPYFVVLGTIEPRKNHALLLDVWEQLGPDAPHLMIVGRRGWANEAVFRRLDTSSMMGRTVFEHGDLDDAAVTALLAGARALLFPSHAEGYGLPALEAACLGTPVVATPLPAFRELLGDYPVYAAPDDPYSWIQAIHSLARQNDTATIRRARALPPPAWETHFNLVLNQF